MTHHNSVLSFRSRSLTGFLLPLLVLALLAPVLAERPERNRSRGGQGVQRQAPRANRPAPRAQPSRQRVSRPQRQSAPRAQQQRAPQRQQRVSRPQRQSAPRAQRQRSPERQQRAAAPQRQRGNQQRMNRSPQRQQNRNIRQPQTRPVVNTERPGRMDPGKNNNRNQNVNANRNRNRNQNVNANRNNNRNQNVNANRNRNRNQNVNANRNRNRNQNVSANRNRNRNQNVNFNRNNNRNQNVNVNRNRNRNQNISANRNVNVNRNRNINTNRNVNVNRNQNVNVNRTYNVNRVVNTTGYVNNNYGYAPAYSYYHNYNPYVYNDFYERRAYRRSFRDRCSIPFLLLGFFLSRPYSAYDYAGVNNYNNQPYFYGDGGEHYTALGGPIPEDDTLGAVQPNLDTEEAIMLASLSRYVDGRSNDGSFQMVDPAFGNQVWNLDLAQAPAVFEIENGLYSVVAGFEGTLEQSSEPSNVNVEFFIAKTANGYEVRNSYITSANGIARDRLYQSPVYPDVQTWQAGQSCPFTGQPMVAIQHG